MAVGEHIPGHFAAAVLLDGQFGQGDGLQRQIGAAIEHGVCHELGGAPCHVVRFRKTPPPSIEQAHLLGLDLRHHGADYLARDALLQIEDVGQHVFITFGPDMVAAFAVDQLRRDAHAVAGLAHTAFEQEVHAQLLGDPFRVQALALVSERAVAGDHEEALKARQLGDDVLDHAVGEILLLGVAAHVGKREYGDRRATLQGRARLGLRPTRLRRGRRRGRPPAVAAHAPGAYRVRQVLHRLFALVIKGGAKFAGHRDADRLGHGDATRLAQAFEPRRNVHAVAVNRPVGLLDHVAQVQTDAKAHALRLGRLRCGGLQLLLHGNRSAHRAGGGLKHGEHRIARHVDDAALVGFDVGSKDPARGIQRVHRGALVQRHQSGIACHVGGKDGGEPMARA